MKVLGGFVVVCGALLLGTVGCSGIPKSYKVYGASLNASKPAAVAIDRVLAHPDEFADKQVRVSGPIHEVCSKRGCWLTLGSGTQTMRARFVESGDCANGFFVPLDAGGRMAILEGTVKQEVITEEEARHYLEDAGASPEEIGKIVGPQKSLSMVCTSVAIQDGANLSEPFKP
ncbi:MAG: DUF4920 domain-containing protein [Planctomycetota bacterium]